MISTLSPNAGTRRPGDVGARVLAPSRFERIPVAVHEGSKAGSSAVAREFAELIRHRQREGRQAVLGLATGSTPVSFYAELVRMHREEGLSFANVVTFNLDEYYPLPGADERSYRQFMRAQLFDHIDLPQANAHVPDGLVAPSEVESYCREYEEKIRLAGGIDLQILGIGRTGHIGFNEPGSSARSRTRRVALDPLTRRDAAGDFGGNEHTPQFAITMGVGTILSARRIILMAWGRHKAGVVKAAIEGDATSRLPASLLQEHEHVQFVLDHAAAGELTRFRTPWLIGPLDEQGLSWDTPMTSRAIIWLSQTRRKAILTLTDDDYNESGLQDLLRIYGSAYETNLIGFYEMQHTITGWPGGRDPLRTRPGAAPVRPLRALSAGTFPKRVLLFSPHPDDDVISMGGTLCRLVDQGHEIHIGYQVSGANAVPDEALWRMLSFAMDGVLASDASREECRRQCNEFLSQGSLPPSAENWRRKGLIRRHEATAAARICGVPPDRLHFLDLPFYDSARGRDRRLDDRDPELIHRLLSSVRPHLIFAAGDLDDPNGTHRLCLHALREAMRSSAGEAWLEESEVWLYRGAWAEWAPDEIDMAVPLSPSEVLRRRAAIFRHETQKDQALFLGNDRREFWQRAEDRGRNLAKIYNAFGLAEYEAIEAFRRLSPDDFLNHTQL